MYNCTTVFKEDGYDLKNILKTCLYKYYKDYKNDPNKDKTNCKMEATKKKILSDGKENASNV